VRILYSAERIQNLFSGNPAQHIYSPNESSGFRLLLSGVAIGLSNRRKDGCPKRKGMRPERALVT
jgi:hypothetical protein